MSKKELKSLTKTKTWETNRTDTEVLTLSCLMRIADALETLTKRYDDLERSVKFYKEQWDRVADQNKTLHYRLAAHKAAYTRLRNKTADGCSEKG